MMDIRNREGYPFGNSQALHYSTSHVRGMVKFNCKIDAARIHTHTAAFNHVCVSVVVIFLCFNLRTCVVPL